MIELDSTDRLSNRLEEFTNGVEIDLGQEPRRDPAARVDSCEAAGAGRDNADASGTELALLIRERLEQHPHFRGRSPLFQIELIKETIILSGRLPSYYLKQLLQEAIMLIPEVVNLDNRVLVMRPTE